MIRLFLILVVLCNWAYCEGDRCCDCCSCCKGENDDDGKLEGVENGGGGKKGFGKSVKGGGVRGPFKVISEEEVEMLKKCVPEKSSNYDKLMVVAYYSCKVRDKSYCPMTPIKWESNNCTLQCELQMRICLSPSFVVFFYLLKKLEFFHGDQYPIISAVCDFVCECVEHPEFETSPVSCMNVLAAVCKYLGSRDRLINGGKNISEVLKYYDDGDGTFKGSRNSVIREMDSNYIVRCFKGSMFWCNTFAVLLLNEFDIFTNRARCLSTTNLEKIIKYGGSRYPLSSVVNFEKFKCKTIDKDKDFHNFVNLIVRDGVYDRSFSAEKFNFYVENKVNVNAIYAGIPGYHVYVCIFYKWIGWYCYDTLGSNHKMLSDNEMMRLLNNILKDGKYGGVYNFSGSLSMMFYFT